MLGNILNLYNISIHNSAELQLKPKMIESKNDFNDIFNSLKVKGLLGKLLTFPVKILSIFYTLK